MNNPFYSLSYESALESLGDEFFDRVSAAEFPQHLLRFRNDDLLPRLGLDPTMVTDEHFIDAFGRFQSWQNCLALRYHGYQFGIYNPGLGDGRGFLYGQVRGVDGELYDFGTKGSGRTPYSRGGDGRLTLKGGVREVLAAEALHYQGVRTSRCLSLIETGESLWRGDEPSPTRSAVMVRFSRSHIRFGTFERLLRIGRQDLVQQLLDHVIAVYYPHLEGEDDRYARFYAELVQRVAVLAAQWMSTGFCHAVLNTDNMSITGESFDYGPYAFIDKLDWRFTAAYFDDLGRYSYGNQAPICKWNLSMLQQPLAELISEADMEVGLSQFDQHFRLAYHQRMAHKLGLPAPQSDAEISAEATELLRLTLEVLETQQIGYHDFFNKLKQSFCQHWQGDINQILTDPFLEGPDSFQALLSQWRSRYHQQLTQLSPENLDQVAARLQRHTPPVPLLRPEIETVWAAIVEDDNWQPFNDLLQRLNYCSDEPDCFAY